MNEKQIFKAMSEVEDRYLTIAEGFQKETKEMKPKIYLKRRTLTALLAAVVAISLLAVTAVATGWIPGIFQELKEENPWDAELFEAAAQANTEIVPEIVELPRMDASRFVLLEKYYDGETILMGYDLDVLIPEPVVGFQPDTELMRKIKRSNKISNTRWGNEEDAELTGKAKKYHLSASTYAMAEMMKETLPEEEYEKAWQLLEAQGWVCVVTQDAWIGDHILLDGQEYYDPETNPDGLRVDYKTEYGDCIRLEVLPEAVRNQTSVTVTLDVKTGIQYWYMDLEGNGRVYYGIGESEEISFELEREAVQ